MCWRSCPRSSCTRTCCTTRPRRLVRSFGLAMVASAYDAGPAAPIPAELEWLRDRCAGLMGREPGELADLLVARYPSGAGIGPRPLHGRRGFPMTATIPTSLSARLRRVVPAALVASGLALGLPAVANAE